MQFEYLGHYVTDKVWIVLTLKVSVGGGPPRVVAVKVPARNLDNEAVHNAMSWAAQEAQEQADSPPWQDQPLELVWG